jgi:hypothetical protein
MQSPDQPFIAYVNFGDSLNFSKYNFSYLKWEGKLKQWFQILTLGQEALDSPKD